MSFLKRLLNIFKSEEEKEFINSNVFGDADKEGFFMDLAEEVASVVDVFGEEVATRLYSLLISTFKNVTPEEFKASVSRMIELTKNKDTIEGADGLTKYELYCLGLTDGISAIRGVSKVILYRSLLQTQVCLVIKMQSLDVFEYKDATFYINDEMYKDPIRVTLFDMEDDGSNMFVRTETRKPVSDEDVVKVVSDGTILFEGSKLTGESEIGSDVPTEFNIPYDKKDPRYNN